MKQKNSSFFIKENKILYRINLSTKLIYSVVLISFLIRYMILLTLKFCLIHKTAHVHINVLYIACMRMKII